MTTATATPTLATYRNKHGHEFDAFDIDGVLVSLRPRNYGDRSYQSKSRVYGAIDTLVPDLNALEPQYVPEFVGYDYDDATRLKGKIWRAWRDGTKKVAQQRLADLMERLAAAQPEGVSIPTGDITFSYKAGCSCGCSPGFILSATARNGYRNADIFLSTLGDGITKV